MNFTNLSYFISSYEEGCMTSTAKKFSVSQCAVSQQISLIEKELGVKLFERRKNKIIPTTEGGYFYKEAKEILKRFENAVNNVREFNVDRSRVIKIGVTNLSEYNKLYYAIEEFCNIYRDYKVKLIMKERRELHKMLESGEVDFIMSIELFTNNNNYKTLEIYDTQFCMVVNKKNEILKKGFLRLSDFSDERIYVSMNASKYCFENSKTLIDIFKEHKIIDKNIFIEESTGSALMNTGLNNGITLCIEDDIVYDELHCKKIHVNEDCFKIKKNLVWNNKMEDEACEKFVLYLTEKMDKLKKVV